MKSGKLLGDECSYVEAAHGSPTQLRFHTDGGRFFKNLRRC